MSLRHHLRRPDGVGVEEARVLIAEGALVVDVRGEREWRRNRIPDSVNIPLAQLEQRALELPDDRLLITFCTGGLLSRGAANLLADLGFDAVDLRRGLIGWRCEGGPLDTPT